MLGYLPIATEMEEDEVVLMPKLHEQRACILLDSPWHVPKKIAKKAREYRLTLNTAFEQVVSYVNEQHGRAWLYPEIAEAYKELKVLTCSESSDGPGEPDVAAASTEEEGCISYNPQLHMYSVEVWNVTSGNLVAGELGYTLGTMYSSLTGFTRESGAGTMQMHALGALLYTTGYEIWDLGMAMDYKMEMGAVILSREKWRDAVQEKRDVKLEGLESWRSETDLVDLLGTLRSTQSKLKNGT